MVLYTGSRKNLYVWLCWLHVVLPSATRMAVGAGRRKMSESDEGSKGPEKEGNQNGIHKREKPRGKKRASSSEGLLQPVKLGKSELYKVPTNEELSHLKETENLFHSNLLRLQIEELLKEVTLKEKKKQRIDAFLHEISAMLRNVPELPARDITDQSWLPKGVKVPILQVPFKVKGKFHFLPPAEVKVVGSYLLGTCIKPEVNVDVAVTMPKEVFQEKDNLNQRYHRKRALYLAHLAQHLAERNHFGSVAFAYANGNHLKPLLLLQPQGKGVVGVHVWVWGGQSILHTCC
ncbi:nucleolar protein 6 [Crotalus adamanteus]|uniref:Nucleolar protein 6 n=1 Tax=Crotalus adamanteus TaxID=8729 RepID=A0AAW1C2E4_CROAD